MEVLAQQGFDYLTRKYLRTRKIPSTACPGCGLGQGHKALLQAIYELDYAIEDIVWGTSIGCAGRQTFGTWKGDGFAGTHGRVYALATGLRMALTPEKKIVLTVGDGDAFGIGLSHLLNAARRNLGVTILVLDNLGYQSTGGQYSWSTPEGAVTDSSPFGMYDPNWIQGGRDILAILREAGATFLGRHVSMEGEFAVETLKKADIVFDTARLIGVPVGDSSNHIPSIIEKYGKDKVAFGTATPFLDYVTPFIRIGVLEEVDDAAKKLIWSENAKRILGL